MWPLPSDSPDKKAFFPSDHLESDCTNFTYYSSSDSTNPALFSASHRYLFIIASVHARCRADRRRDGSFTVMPTLQLPDGSTREVNRTRPRGGCRGHRQTACDGRSRRQVNGTIVDLEREFEDATERSLSTADRQGPRLVGCAAAQLRPRDGPAVMRLFPGTQLAVRPTTETASITTSTPLPITEADFPARSGDEGDRQESGTVRTLRTEHSRGRGLVATLKQQ